MTGKPGQKGSALTDVPEEYTEGWLRRIDGRSAVARALNSRIRALENDLGGPENLSYAQRSLISRAIFIEQHIVNMESDLTENREIDSAAWLAAVGQLQRLYSALGLKRVPKDVPDLQQYIKTAYGKADNEV